jgi:hypothetical protein
VSNIHPETPDLQAAERQATLGAQETIAEEARMKVEDAARAAAWSDGLESVFYGTLVSFRYPLQQITECIRLRQRERLAQTIG